MSPYSLRRLQHFTILFKETSISPYSLRRLSDVLKRKKPPKRPARKGNKNDDSLESSSKSSSSRGGRGRLNAKEKGNGGSSSKMSFLPSLNPRSWGRLGGSSSSSSSSADRPLLSKVSQVGALNYGLNLQKLSRSIHLFVSARVARRFFL